jgi:hypothetical protein
MTWHQEEEAGRRSTDQKYRGPRAPYSPDPRLLDIQDNAGGFTVWGRPVYATRAQRRRNAAMQVVGWALKHRPDVLTPVQREALELYYNGPAENAEYCVDEDGRRVAPDDVLSPDGFDRRRYIRGPLTQSQAARYLDIPDGRFRDRLQRAERNATNAWNYHHRERGESIPDVLTKYRRRRTKVGRAKAQESAG